MTEIVGHFLVFTVAAIGFLIAPLLIGKLVRPRLPNAEKDATYECGEPTIGSSYIQFDLRFYVVALLFIIFDVEVVFFFPWATIFGNAMQLADPLLSFPARIHLSEQLLSATPGSITADTAVTAETALQLGWIAFTDVAAFFAVLLVGFAYVWKRGDLDWVRTTIEQKSRATGSTRPFPQAKSSKPVPATAS
jgi:NADH-quinone oxidoreductase subunit A